MADRRAWPWLTKHFPQVSRLGMAGISACLKLTAIGVRLYERPIYNMNARRQSHISANIRVCFCGIRTRLRKRLCGLPERPFLERGKDLFAGPNRPFRIARRTFLQSVEYKNVVILWLSSVAPLAAWSLCWGDANIRHGLNLLAIAQVSSIAEARYDVLVFV